MEQKYKITIELFDQLIILDPISVHKIIDTVTQYNVVTFHNICINKITHEKVESLIRYYISDGHTNNLRANLLYPMICFNSDTGDSCPDASASKMLPHGGILKYNICENVNYHKLEEILLNHVGSYYAARHEKGNIKKISANLYGLISIFKRVSNLIDFIILLSSNSIVNLDPNFDEMDPRCLRPVLIKGKEFDMTTCDKTTPLNELDHYRIYLMRMLKEYLTFSIKYNIIKLTPVDLPIIKTNIDDFNNIIGVCKNGNVSDIALQNINNYAKISTLIHSNIKLYLKKLNRDGTSEKDMEFREIFDSVLADKTRMFNINGNIMTYQLYSWNAECKVPHEKQTGGDNNYKQLYKNYKLRYLNLIGGSIDVNAIYDIEYIHNNVYFETESIDDKKTTITFYNKDNDNTEYIDVIRLNPYSTRNYRNLQLPQIILNPTIYNEHIIRTIIEQHKNKKAKIHFITEGGTTSKIELKDKNNLIAGIMITATYENLHNIELFNKMCMELSKNTAEIILYRYEYANYAQVKTLIDYIKQFGSFKKPYPMPFSTTFNLNNNSIKTTMWYKYRLLYKITVAPNTPMLAIGGDDDEIALCSGYLIIKKISKYSYHSTDNEFEKIRIVIEADYIFDPNVLDEMEINPLA